MSEIKVSVDQNMRAARVVELQRQRDGLVETIREQETAGDEGDQTIVALRASKVEAHRADIVALDAELDAIRAFGHVLPEEPEEEAEAEPAKRKPRKHPAHKARR